MKMNIKFLNSAKGTIFYGMHFCPGVAEYEKPGEEAFRVFLNEDTIRKMNPTFAGCPMFVEHVDEVDENINLVRGEADGWVLESFFNAADGKTWAKFIIVSDRGLQAIRKGFRLSNAYTMKESGPGGVWNGVTFRNEVTGGEFEHLAIVQNPRYDESVILTPEQFKQYNEEKTVELKRLANSKDKKGESTMKFFKRTKIENSAVDTSTLVELPLSKKEVSLEAAINGYDKFLNMNGYANGDHMVKVGDKDEMSVNDLVKKHIEACNELDSMKKPKDDAVENEDDMDSEDPAMENEDSEEIVSFGMKSSDRGGDKSLENEEDEEKDEDGEPGKKKMNNATEIANARKVLAKAKAARLKNAHTRAESSEIAPTILLPRDQVARGKAMFGSSK